MENVKAAELTSVKLAADPAANCTDGLKIEDLEKASKKVVRKFKLIKKRRKEIRNRRSHSNSGKTRMFGVKCNFGTDDFFFLSLFSMLLRAAWLVYGVVICTYIFILRAKCISLQIPLTLQISLPGLLLLAFLSITCHLMAVLISSRGSLIRPRPREKVVGVVYILLVIAVMEVGWYIFSTYAVVVAGVDVDATQSSSGAGEADVLLGSGSGTEDAAVCVTYRSWVIHFGVLVGLAWICYALIVAAFLLGLDPCGCFLPSKLIQQLINAHELEKEDYVVGQEKPLADYNKFDGGKSHHTSDFNISLACSRLRQCCCSCVHRDGLSNSSKQAFADVVDVLRLLFTDIDATYSDLVAGFLLASLYQRNLRAANKNIDAELNKATLRLLRESHVSCKYVTPPPKQLSPAEAEELAEELQYYFKFSAAAYGCSIHVYLHPCTGPLSLCLAAKGCCCCCNMFQLEHFDGDTCYPNGPAIQVIADVEQEEIITASFINSVCKVPYYAVYQQEEKRMVIAIRGTFSFKDALTDVSVSMWEIPGGLLGVPQAYIHKGFYDTAMYVYKSLMDRRRFTSRLNTSDVREIVITGHSLGAAVAAVLAVIFKENHKDEPWIGCLRAITFSTPAACMSYNLAEKTSDFITTVVGANDLVSRMTIRSLGYLKLLVGSMLVSVDVPKHKILCCSGRGWTQCCPPKVQNDENLVGLAYSKAELQSVEALNIEGDLQKTSSYKKLRTYKPEFSLDPKWSTQNTRTVVSKFNKELDKVRGGAEKRDDQPMMFLPGRILHLEETENYGRSKFGLRKHRKVQGSWKARESLTTIVVHRDMLLDHMPHRFQSLLQRFRQHPDFTVPLKTTSVQIDEIDAVIRSTTV